VQKGHDIGHIENGTMGMANYGYNRYEVAKENEKKEDDEFDYGNNYQDWGEEKDDTESQMYQQAYLESISNNKKNEDAFNEVSQGQAQLNMSDDELLARALAESEKNI